MRIYDNSLVKIGNLEDVLDGNGTVAIPCEWKSLDATRHEVTLTVTILLETFRPTAKSTGFIVPMNTVFDKVYTGWTLRKVLLAPTSFTVPDPSTYDLATKSYFGGALPVLRCCTQLLPLTPEEEFLCRINGIAYEQVS